MKYTLDSYTQPLNNINSDSSSSPTNTAIPAELPILPFPFPDILLQGQRTQLNLYERRFHELFADAVENHAGMVGMGLLTGNGMITTLPLCEVESFTRFGAEDDWKDTGDGMGNGSIFVTIRAVGRARIVEELLQEEPYMKAKVVEIFDEDVATFGLKESNNGGVKGESSPIEIASLVAGNIENIMISLAGMEHKLNEIESKKTVASDSPGDVGNEEKGDEVINRRIVNAQLESLFMNDSADGIDMGSEIEDDEEEDEGEDDELEDGDETLDRMSQYQKAFESAKEADTFGYVLQPRTAIDDLSNNPQSSSIRTPKDLTAISWAAFCTGEANNVNRDVMKIQALDMVDVSQRLQLAVAMLSEEQKKLKAKLLRAGIRNIMDEEL